MLLAYTVVQCSRTIVKCKKGGETESIGTTEVSPKRSRRRDRGTVETVGAVTGLLPDDPERLGRDGSVYVAGPMRGQRPSRLGDMAPDLRSPNGI